jgi:hypothetical protein
MSSAEDWRSRGRLRSPQQPLTLPSCWRGVFFQGGKLAEISQFSIVTYERRPGYWRAAITPHKPSGNAILGKTTSSFVTPDDFDSEADAKFAAEKMIRKL